MFITVRWLMVASLTTVSTSRMTRQTNYLRFVGELCLPHLGSTVLDVGAGFGAITEQIATGRTVTALDTSPACADALQSRFADNSNVTVVHGDLSALGTERFDSILLTNVLEHIADDAGFLADLKSLLLPRGRIVIYVPALNGLYTGWDRKVGHYRRYSKRRLAGVICEADDHLAVTYMRYANMLAIPAWLFSGRMVDEKAREARSLDASRPLCGPGSPRRREQGPAPDRAQFARCCRAQILMIARPVRVGRDKSRRRWLLLVFV